MSAYYFAYGSNMNPSRMQARNMAVDTMFPGVLPGFRLAFNKRAADAPGLSYANVVYDVNQRVEGVLYRLSHPREIKKMDHFEGTPRFYSRELFLIDSEQGPIPAWMYVANRAMIEEGLNPSREYLDHLLAGRAFISKPYFTELAQTPCVELDEV